MTKEKAVKILKRRIVFLENRISKTPEEKRELMVFDLKEKEALDLAIKHLS